MRIVRRDNGSKADIPTTNLVEHVRDLLSNIHESLFKAAKIKRDACKKIVYTWEEFITALNEKKWILAPWCDEEVCTYFIFIWFIRFNGPFGTTVEVAIVVVIN